MWALLDDAAVRCPEATAMFYAGARYTFRQLQARSLALACGLRARGVTRGDRVALWLPNVPLWIELMFACARLGAVVVAINTRFKALELGDILGRSGARTLVYWPGFRGIDFTGILEGVDKACLSDLRDVVAYGEGETVPRQVCGRAVIHSDALPTVAADAATAGKAQDGCVIYTTSGTTSRPKLVVHAQRSIFSHAVNTSKVLGYGAPQTVIQVVTPLSGVSGFGMPFAAIAARRPFVLMPTFEAHESIALIRRRRVTHVHANHEIIRRWLEVLSDDDDVSSLRCVNCGSGMAELFDRARAHGIALQSIYGSSELQARFSRQRQELAPERIFEAGGFPLSPHAEVRAVDIDSGRLLPQGEKGELQVRAPSQMLEYFGDAEATARGITDDGYVRTGDCGYTRADGSFVHEARIGDVLKLSGFMTSPAEIEATLMAFPGVAQCAVVGVATATGQRAVAFVRCADHFDEQAMTRFCSDRLARYKVPARIVRLEKFPITTGANAPKVQKSKLREMAQALQL